MRDTSHNLVINKHTLHPIKHLTSPCSSPITTASRARMEGISKSAKRGQYANLGQGGTSHPPPSAPPVCLWADESSTQTRAPQRRSHAPLSSSVAGPRSLDCGFVPAAAVSVAFAGGFVNTHTFCERCHEWDEVTDCRSGEAASEGERGYGY